MKSKIRLINNYFFKTTVISIILLFTACTSSGSFLEYKYISLSEKVMPSVVEIIAVGIEDENATKWYDFFQDQENLEKEDLNTGIGSGVIVERNGDNYYIITNKHVVGQLEEVSVMLHNEEILKGSVIGFDDRFDIAVVEIESKIELSVAKVSTKGNLKVGQFVAAIGSPMSYVQSVSMGIISNLYRFGGPKGNLSNYIQTDAAINHGNSGGPLVNMRGEVIGINTWISSPTSGNIGLGFAMPIENVYPSFLSIVKDGFAKVSWLGVSTYTEPKEDYYKDNKGAFINHVVINSPAYNGGILPGDIIQKVNSKTISSSEELFLEISRHKPDDNIIISLFRNNSSIEIPIKLKESEDNSLEISKSVFPGFILIKNEDKISILQLLPKSVGLSAGFIKDDQIKSINGINVDTVYSFYSNLKKGLNSVVILRDEVEVNLELNY